VPNDLKLAGKEETFNVEVRYDTLDLYGRINARRSITIRRE